MTLFDWVTLFLPLVFAGVLLWRWRRTRLPLGEVFGTSIDRSAHSELGVGLAIGSVAMMAVFGVELALGAIEVTGVGAPTNTWWRWILFLLVAAVIEEILSRSFMLGGLVVLLRSRWVAVLVSAIYFGAAHAANPGATVVSIASHFLGGVMYAVAYLGSRRIWMPFGVHFTWNFVQGLVLGFPVSGMTTPRLLQQAATGPDWLTGGSYGPEAGLVGLCARLLVILMLLAWFRRPDSHNGRGEVARPG